MLDTHPDLAIPGESHFIPARWKARRRYTNNGVFDVRRLADDIQRTSHVRQWQLPPDAVRVRVEDLLERDVPAPSFPEIVEAVFLAYADHTGKARWGDKTPIYVLYMSLLASLFPMARFVHVVRDGRDVALSYLSVPWGPSTIWQAARKWRRDVSAGLRAGADLGPARYTQILYTDLVTSAEPTLRGVCEFASLPYDDRMLDYHHDAQDRIQSRPERTRYHASVARPPTKGLRDWRTQMTEGDVQAFETTAGDLLNKLGFERRHPTSSLPLRAEAAARVSALDLKATASEAKKFGLRALGRPVASIRPD